MKAKAQAAIDFLSSYGFALLIIAIALYVIFHLAFFNQRIAPTYCTPASSFGCGASALSSNTAVYTIVLYQATGGTVNVHAAACSTAANTVGDWPQWGNVNMVPYSVAPQYYPATGSNLQSTLSMYSSSVASMSVICYGPSGKATAAPGSTFTGYLWLNYTFTNLPATTNTIERVISFSTKYT